jgi:hypothetical protein
MVRKIAEGAELAFLHRNFNLYLQEHFKTIAELPKWVQAMRNES